MKQRLHIFQYACLISVIGLTILALITSRFGWPLYLEIFSHFQVQYFLATFGIMAITLLLRHYRLLLGILFCSAVLSAQIIPWYIPASLHTQPANYRILLANLNLSNNDASQTLALMETEQPDLALFLETSTAIEKQLTTLRTTLPYSTKMAADHGILLYSKYPFTDLELQQFGRYARESLAAHLTINGSPISFIASHPLPPLASGMFLSRNTLLQEVGNYIKTQMNPVIFLGDLNITMWSPYYQTLEQQTHLRNARKGFGIRPTWPRAVSYYGLPDWFQGLISPLQIPIDHCLVSPQIQVTDIHTGTDTGSDHAPLVVDLFVPNSKQNATGELEFKG